MNTTHLPLAALLASMIVMGCTERGASSVQEKVANPVPVVSDAVSDQWSGKWNGPEGTFLQIEVAGERGKYEVTIRNLDGARTFQGTAVAAGIEFERDGAKEMIRATSGVETGMKWLTGKSNCLTVRIGEGYCKD